MDKPHPYYGWTNVASRRLGARVLKASDDFFASKHNIIKDEEPLFISDRYTPRGKWMDGWESRRRRTGDEDSIVISLAAPAQIVGIDVNTAYFLGNAPRFVKLEGCLCQEQGRNKTYDFVPLTEKCSVEPGAHNYLSVSSSEIVDTVRLRIFPDGGVARLRVYGQIVMSQIVKAPNQLINVAGMEYGARCLNASDMFFGHAENMLAPYPPQSMHDGWETKRRRDSGFDWCIVQLAARAAIEIIEIDTRFFKGNYPDQASVEGYDGGDFDVLVPPVFREEDWKPLLPKVSLKADARHIFKQDKLAYHGKLTHLRLKIFPDGGVARFKCWGVVG